MTHSRDLQADWQALRPDQRAALTARSDWLDAARPEQVTPDGDWDTWLILAGRGWGKTRTGAEDAAWYGQAHPESRIAIVAPTWADARDTCIEGESGLLSTLPRDCIAAWNRSLGELVLKNGSRYKVFSAEEPDRLRGPQHHRAWCFVAGTMVATPSGERPIETLEAGDLVLTRKGPKPVIANASRRAVVGRVLFSNSRELVGTAEHPVYASRGWTNLSALGKGMAVCAIGALSGRGGLGTFTAEGAEAITKGRTSPGEGSERFGFIGKYGLLNAVRFPMASMSTILTGIARTTGSKTLRFSRIPGIAQSIARLNPMSTLIGMMSQPNTGRAAIAVRGLNASGLAVASFAGHASIGAQKPSERLPGVVRGVERNSSPVTETIAVSVASTWQRMAVREVFCLKVEGEPEYFANGILVHNCDELAAWKYPETWDQLLFGLRLGSHPQAVVTTTPKPTQLIKRLAADPTTRLTRGSTFDNAANLAPSALARLREKYEGTRLGRQELNAEILGDLPGALWSMATLDAYRLKAPPKLTRVLVAVDPAASHHDDSDEHGIVVGGLAEDQRGVVIEDATLRGTPLDWARRAIALYRSHAADGIVVEVNQGGDMVAHTLRTIDPAVNIIEVRASRGKHVRAEPIAALYEQGRIAHAGAFPELETQMTQMTQHGYEGQGSPDRVDALVWLMSELFPGMVERRADAAQFRMPRRQGGWLGA